MSLDLCSIENRAITRIRFCKQAAATAVRDEEEATLAAAAPASSSSSSSSSGASQARLQSAESARLHSATGYLIFSPCPGCIVTRLNRSAWFLHVSLCSQTRTVHALRVRLQVLTESVELCLLTEKAAP